MKVYTIILLSIILFAAGRARAQKECGVTYIANEGVLIESGNHKIVIDALFGGIKGNWCEEPSEESKRLMMSGAEPFAKTEFALVTHRHIDHFRETEAADFLKANNGTVLICPLQTKEKMSSVPGYDGISGRIIYLSAGDTVIKSEGISIRAIKMRHGAYYDTDSITGKKTDRHRNTDNYVYLVNINAVTVFHSGDCSIDSIQPFKDCGPWGAIDIGFLNRSFFGKEGMEVLNYLGPEKVVIMHLDSREKDYFKSVYKDFPEIKIFDSLMEKKYYRF